MTPDFYVQSFAAPAANTVPPSRTLHVNYTRADVEDAYERGLRAGYYRGFDDCCLALRTLRGE